MTTTLVTGIGELVTNDPALGDGPARACRATPRSSSTDGASRGSARASRAPGRRPAASTSAGGPSCRASSTATPTWSSPATARAEFEARMTGAPYDGGGIATTVAATRAASDDAAAGPARGPGRRDARAGHDDRRGQERLRAHRRATRRARCGWPREVTAETTFLGAHVVPAEYADRATTTSTW